MSEVDYDVMVFVRWSKQSPFTDNVDYVWRGDNSAIVIVKKSVYLLFREIIQASLWKWLSEIQLIKPRTA